jgi:ubiquitin C-terminal hydrolase
MLLDLSKYMDDMGGNGRLEVELYGIIVHSGENTNSGHYYAFVKCGEQWFEVPLTIFR